MSAHVLDLFVCLLKAYSPANRTGSPESFHGLEQGADIPGFSQWEMHCMDTELYTQTQVNLNIKLLQYGWEEGGGGTFKYETGVTHHDTVLKRQASLYCRANHARVAASVEVQLYEDTTTRKHSHQHHTSDDSSFSSSSGLFSLPFSSSPCHRNERTVKHNDPMHTQALCIPSFCILVSTRCLMCFAV